ncbi:MAG: hypothetical protein EBQ94_04395 [Flavobacteriales bacterium]|nr:hypothetical protein [Flavobacteriales bacterium]NCA20029.1 hypothetical protein [Crocinitomicaceae bacterium]
MYVVSSCVKNNPDPSWLQVNEWDLVDNISLNEGELTQNFSDAWVYVDDQLIGVFQVPFKIPILKSGPVNIKLFPAIKNNGISATKKVYPFVKTFEVNAVLTQNQTLVINPITQYKENLNFWIEDFEDLNFKIVSDPNTSATDLTTESNNLPSTSGNSCGKVVLNASDSTWIAYVNQQLTIAKGLECYLEIDYHVTNNLVTGLIYVTSSETKNNVNIRLNAQTPETVVWKKIYIDLKELIGNSPTGSKFLPSFSASLDEGDTEGEILIDNIKVIHF